MRRTFYKTTRSVYNGHTMGVNYLQLKTQVKEVGEAAAGQVGERRLRLEQALALLHQYAGQGSELRPRVEQIAASFEQTLRCASPAHELLDAHFALPALPAPVRLLAADGSQIEPDRHAEVEYGLVNAAVLDLVLGASQPAARTVVSRLYYGERVFGEFGLPSSEMLELQRDLEERVQLADRASEPFEGSQAALTDGPLELWGAKQGRQADSFERSLEVYQQSLRDLWRLGVAYGGYVDKPAAGLVVRLLEVALLDRSELGRVRDHHPLEGVRDRAVFARLLGPNERSAVFALQSGSTHRYREALALHFFYLNTGREGRPRIARVEIPAWVAQDARQLDLLHAVLVQQCQSLSAAPYPYLLHRAHEEAVVSLQDKEQITQMLLQELRGRGVEVDGLSSKLFLKLGKRGG